MANTIFNGQMYINASNKALEFIRSQMHPNGTLPISYLIPQDDPAYGVNIGAMNYRSFAYDIGLALLVFTANGDYENCEKIMNRLAFIQGSDGTFDSSFDHSDGRLGDPQIRMGNQGWIVWGMSYYMLASGSRKSAYMNALNAAGEWILSQQINDNPASNGLLRAGYGSFDRNGNYQPGPVEWISTEHQCSTTQALVGLALLTGDPRYTTAADLVLEWLTPNPSNPDKSLYDSVNGRYKQGYDDPEWALDCSTWAGTIALKFLNNTTVAEACRNSANNINNFLVQNTNIVKSTNANNYNQTYELNAGVSVDGFKPYKNAAEYGRFPDIVWTEGTLGYAYLCMLLGQNTEAIKYMDEMIKLQNCNASGGRTVNGIIYATKTYNDLEFHVWESVVSSAWLYLMVNNPGLLFPKYPSNLKTLTFTIPTAFFEEYHSGNSLQGEIYTTNYVAISIIRDDSLVIPMPTLYYPEKDFQNRTFTIPIGEEAISQVHLRITYNYRYHRWTILGGTIVDETKDILVTSTINLNSSGQASGTIPLHDDRQSNGRIDYSISTN